MSKKKDDANLVLETKDLTRIYTQGDKSLTILNDVEVQVNPAPIADAGDIIATVDATFSPSAGVQILLWDATDGTTAKDGDCFVEITVSYSADEI